MDINVCLFSWTSHPPRVVFMSDSSGEIDLFFDMPPGKRMSSERRFDMNSEYERGRHGVRVHLLVSGLLSDRAAASLHGAMDHLV